jgi:hypothetical protein
LKVLLSYYIAAATALPPPQLTQDDDPQHEQLPQELEPLVAAVSPSRDASDTSIISISSIPLNSSLFIVYSSFFFFE